MRRIIAFLFFIAGWTLPAVLRAAPTLTSTPAAPPANCASLPSASTPCTVVLNWALTSLSPPSALWVNGTLLSTCPLGTLSGSVSSPNMFIGTTYSYKLMTGSNVCSAALSGTQLDHVDITPTSGTGLCGAGAICGTIKSESNANLPDRVINLLSPTGAVLQTTTSNSSGYYTFVLGPPIQSSYYVAPAIDRGESVSPSQASVSPSLEAPDFVVHGIAAKLQFSGLTNGTLVLVAPTAPVSRLPAAGVMPVASPGIQDFYTNVSGPTGQFEIDVPSSSTGISYGYICWVLVPSVGYTRSPAHAVLGGAALSAGQTVSTGLTCP